MSAASLAVEGWVHVKARGWVCTCGLWPLAVSRCDQAQPGDLRYLQALSCGLGAWSDVHVCCGHCLSLSSWIHSWATDLPSL